MKEKSELNKIAAGIIEKEITMAEDLSMDDIDKLFPTLMDLTLRDAAKMLERHVRIVFQWNKKKVDGSFADWEELDEEEWAYVNNIVKSAPKKPMKPHRKRRMRHHGQQKAAKN